LRSIGFWWLLTRAIVVAAFLVSAPHPIQALGNWDGAWYGEIAQHGYAYSTGVAARSSAAFFPLFPLIAAAVIRAAVAWPLAGALVNSLAFLLLLPVLYRLAERRFDSRTAQLTIATACALPLSLFGTVAYSEGIFMLTSALALDFFECRRFAVAGTCGALASAARAAGTPLALALGVSALVERRGARAFGAALAAFAGIAALALYDFLHFGDALAFVHAQWEWHRGIGFDWISWRGIAAAMFVHWDPEAWRLNWQMLLLVPCGAFVLALHAKRLGLLFTLYGFFALAMLLAAGTPLSASRTAYAIVPILIALGATWRRAPVLGAIVVAAGLVLLWFDTAAFARFHWVA
jgi:Gpi18-like mannosyltransferase